MERADHLSELNYPYFTDLWEWHFEKNTPEI